MDLHTLKPAKGSVRKRKRIGRGQGSGTGGTAARGHKGQKSRSGYSRKKGFEGGQMPIQRRLPKRGFKNINRVEYVALNLASIQAIADKHNVTDFTMENLVAKGIVKKNDKVKVLARGELKSSVNVTLHAYSEKAKSAIEAAGGKANVL